MKSVNEIRKEKIESIEFLMKKIKEKTEAIKEKENVNWNEFGSLRHIEEILKELNEFIQ